MTSNKRTKHTHNNKTGILNQHFIFQIDSFSETSPSNVVSCSFSLTVKPKSARDRIY